MSCSTALAQTEPEAFDQVMYPAPVDSGPRSTLGPAGSVLYAKTVKIDGAPWIRVLFDDAVLTGGAYVRITSTEDGEVQFLDDQTIKEWQLTTAYFNGPEVLIELVGAVNTKDARIIVSRVLAGSAAVQPDPERRVCLNTDERVLSTSMQTARLLSVRMPVPACAGGFPCGTVGGALCSGSLIADAPFNEPNNRILLSAGHCFAGAGMTVAQFEPIPLSTSACQFRHPPVAKQFAVDPNRVRFQNAGTGNDWSAFVLFANPVTGRTALQEQGAAFTRGAPPAVNDTIRKFGYGSQGEIDSGAYCTCEPGGSMARFNGVQQTDTGNTGGVAGTTICHDVHTCGGDSGSPLIGTAGANNGRLVGIHTAGICTDGPIGACPRGLPLPRNAGTTINHPALVNAINQLTGAAPPANNACANAIVVNNGTTEFSTNGATTDGPAEALCLMFGNNQVAQDIWFRYTATGAGNTIFSLCGSGYDTRLALYPNACPPAAGGTALACDDDNAACGAGSKQSQITFVTAAGTTYIIRVGGFGTQAGLGRLTITPPGAPPNDYCANATDVSAHGVFAGTLVGATTDGSCSCGDAAASPDVWFRYLASQEGLLTVSTCGTSDTGGVDAGMDTVLSLHDTCPGTAANQVADFFGNNACNDDTTLCGALDAGARTDSAIRIYVERGDVLYIRVSRPSMAVSRAFTLRLSIALLNDACASAFTIPTRAPGTNGPTDPGAFGDGIRGFTTLGATTDGPAACGISQDVWLRYDAVANGSVEVDTCVGSNFDTFIAAYNGAGCAPFGMQLACNDNACGMQSRICFPVTAGNPYLIRLGRGVAPAGSGFFNLRFVAAGGVCNNACDNASTATNGANTFDSTGATTDGPAGCPANQDVWFTYSPSRSGQVTAETCVGTAFDTVIAAYTGACGALTLIPGACNDDTAGCGNGLQSRIRFQAQIGVTYLIRVGGFGAQAGPGVLTITEPPALPVNDACANFITVTTGVTPFNTSGATTDGAAACPVNQDIWYRYVATTARTRFSLCGSFYDTRLAVYRTNACLPANQVGCDDDFCGLQSQVTVPTLIGATYTVRVGGFGAEAGEGVLTISALAPCCDWNNDGIITSQDFFDFLVAFFAGTGDFNGNGAVTSQDLFDFFACFFLPPFGCP
ncbi:MAG: serine protease [Phycisphaerales bacterium]